MEKGIRAFREPQLPNRAPVRLAEVLAGSAPSDGRIDLEIGCGVGFHPIRYALTHPDRRLIAIEHTHEKFTKFARRVENHRAGGEALANLVPVHANAIGWVSRLEDRECFDRIFLMYPNPHPKAKQANQRWFRMPFMGRLLETLKRGGTLRLATNLEFYADEAAEFGIREWGLTLERRVAFTPENPIEGAPRTHFEKKYLADGQTCHDLLFRKT